MKCRFLKGYHDKLLFEHIFFLKSPLTPLKRTNLLKLYYNFEITLEKERKIIYNHVKYKSRANTVGKERY